MSLPAALALASVAAVSTGAAAPVTEVLPNGMRVTVVAEPQNPVVAIQVWYHVGSANEGPDSRGLAHLFEHMMFSGTERYGERDVWDLHHENGGDNNAYTSPDETVYVSEIPPGAELEVLAIEADRMRNLAIDAETLQNEKRIVTEELRLRGENDPLTRVMIVAQKALLGDHPYAYDASGSKRDVAAATVESCRAFYDRFYRPGLAHLVVVGPVDAEATLAEARRLFGPLPAAGGPPEDVQALIERSYPPDTVLKEDLPPVETAIVGFPLPPADSDDYWALMVLGQLLGGGSVNPFEEELVRRRRKALAAGNMMLTFRRGGAFVFYSAHLPYRRKATAYRLIDRARDELSALEWLDEETLAAAKRTLRRRELRAGYFSATRADAIGRAQWWQHDETLAFERAARLEAVTREQVADAYRRYLVEPEPIRLYIKPEKVPIWIRAFGWLYPLVSR
jgi:zinc protease